MANRSFSRSGLMRLHETLAEEVGPDRLPGLVWGARRGSDLHTQAIGFTGTGASEVMRSDALFRITSMTRPVTALATLLLVDDGVLNLDSPVGDLLPELAQPRVLRRLDGPLEETVAVERPISVRDLLTFRAGFGTIMAAASDYPILQAEAELQLCSVGPPTPVTPLEPDEWMRRMGSLPRMEQPGQQWRYNTGSQILGVLVARASGQSADSFYRERIFNPLGMDDTSFSVPAGDLHRLAPCFSVEEGCLLPFDDDAAWSRPRPFVDGGAGLVSTASDYLAFGRMLLAGGVHNGQRIVSAELVQAMTSDQLTREQRASAGPILGGRGWGFGLSIIDTPEGGSPGPLGYGWSGGYGTVWLNDPGQDLVAVLLTQVLYGTASVEGAFWSGLYGALGG